LRKSDNEPTSIILVSKSTSTPDFIAEKIVKLKVKFGGLLEKAIFHTTCFALSKNPARTTILASAKKRKL
jgi:fructokinase